MDQDENSLSRSLVLYQFADAGANPKFTLHIQLGPGCGYIIYFELLQKKDRLKVKELSFLLEKPLLSLTGEDDDIVSIHAIAQDGTVVAGGIWQVQWRNDEACGGVNGYVFREVTSSGIEMVKVETLLQEEEYVLLEDAVDHAKAFLEEHGSASDIDFVAGREVGVSAPERMHQVTPLPPDIRAVEHTWLLVFSGSKEYIAKTHFFLTEVTYRFQDGEWQFSVRVLREGNDHETRKTINYVK